MSGWLLDTNILSELRRKQPAPAVIDFVAAQPLHQLHVSTVTFAEIRYGIELLDDAERRAALTHWLDHRLRPMFQGRILPLCEDTLLQWRLIIESGRRRRHTFSHPDVLIAASAAHHGVTVVTRDTADFEAAGVPVCNPWRQSAS
ncbi:VapC toxin family PIN domain ribonuclease [Thiohalocapsa halophila]|uniref:Ribonuclease VapC n=1 Tax=Thiohalocapsa halophila TaxID=69359 RepID=A0ABS1CJ20_9GAMM|nr:type II toxin-antitoxin system VapC family toxin [Thiohalocapsa halophila]MBK1631494.1 VapC toxin family PIN domain ribonuclease [Thiohalocapsa halophila]